MTRLYIAAAALMVAACTESTTAPLESASEAEDIVAALQSARAPLDPDFSLHLGPVAATGGILIYDIQNGFVYDGDASAARLLLNVHDGAIFDAADEVILCRFVHASDGLSVIAADTREPLYVLERNLIYDGGGRLRFSLMRDQIFDGHWSRGEPLMTATERIDRMSGERKLLVAVLAGGECGAPELPQRSG
jgi:hypothetical protein